MPPPTDVHDGGGHIISYADPSAGDDHRGAGRAAIGRRAARREWPERGRHVPPPPPPTVRAHECRPRATHDRTSSVVIDRVSK